MNKNKIENKKFKNLIIVTNIYSLVSNTDQINSINSIFNKNEENILIYDFFESGYKPENLIINKIKNVSNFDKFLMTNNFQDIQNIIQIFLLILFSKRNLKLYLDSANTLIQQIFFILFCFKKYKINGLCFNFPYAYQIIKIKNGH